MAFSLVAGVAVRVWQYAANHSFWLDELAVVNNLLQRSAGELFSRPLDFAQVAPLGWLVTQRMVLAIAGPSELALRAWSLLAGLGALFLTAFIARRLVDRRAAWVVAALVAVSPGLVMQSAQLKPYSGDACLALACLAMALRVHERGIPQRWWTMGLLGALAPWWSFTAAFALAAPGIAVVMQALEGRREQAIRNRAAMLLALWMASGLASLWMAYRLVTPATREYMREFWSMGRSTAADAASFTFPWPLGRLRTLLWELGDFRGATILVLVLVAGIVLLAWRRPRVALIVGLPLAAGLAADRLGIYPMQSRLAHWALALIAILLVHGMSESVRLVLRQRWNAVQAGAVAALVVFPVIGFAQRRPPVPLGTAREVLERVAAATPDGGQLYVHWRAWQAWTFYGRQLEPAKWSVSLGGCSRADRGLMLRELSRFRGSSTWILLSHLQAEFRERETVERFMERSGARLHREVAVARTPDQEAQFTHALHYDISSMRRDSAGVDALIEEALSEVPARESECAPSYIPPGLDRTPR